MRRGVTLVELCFAIGVLVLSLVGLLSVISGATRAAAASRESLGAMNVARRHLERLSLAPPPRGGSFTESDGGVDYAVLVEVDTVERELDLDGDGRVDGKDHATDARIVPVSVTVTWPGRSATYRTLLYPRSR
jgi:hypothetical protein